MVFLSAIHYSLSTAFALDVPQLKYHVNDYANMMSSEARAKIEGDLKAFEQSDSTQIVILTIQSLEGEEIAGYSIKVAEAWKIGQKGKDNGVIFLVAKQERKMRIEVGRGLEGKLTDLVSGQIIDRIVKPRFAKGDFDGGFLAVTQALIDATRGEFKAEKRAVTKKRQGTPLPVIIIFGAIALIALGRVSRVLGGTAGAVGFPLIGFLLGFPLLTIVLIGLLGLVMGIFLPLLFGGLGRGGGGGGFWPGGFGGGGFGGGGGDSGGFDGGGGDFGGGGASGDW